MSFAFNMPGSLIVRSDGLIELQCCDPGEERGKGPGRDTRG